METVGVATGKGGNIRLVMVELPGPGPGPGRWTEDFVLIGKDKFEPSDSGEKILEILEFSVDLVPLVETATNAVNVFSSNFILNLIELITGSLIN